MGIIEDKLKLLPEKSGCYIMLDEKGDVIYVGKAKVLKNRVRQYFHSNKKPEKVMAMVANIEDFYYIITNSEIDALSLEFSKKHFTKAGKWVYIHRNNGRIFTTKRTRRVFGLI